MVRWKILCSRHIRVYFKITITPAIRCDLTTMKRSKRIQIISIGILLMSFFTYLFITVLRIAYGGYDYRFSIPYDNIEIRTVCSRKANKTVVFFHPLSEERHQPDYIVYEGISPYLEFLIDKVSPSSLYLWPKSSQIINTAHFTYYDPLFEEFSKIRFIGPYNHLRPNPSISMLYLRYEFSQHCYESHVVGDSIVVANIIKRTIKKNHPLDSLEIELERKYREGRWEELIQPEYSKEYIFLRRKQIQTILPDELHDLFCQY